MSSRPSCRSRRPSRRPSRRAEAVVVLWPVAELQLASGGCDQVSAPIAIACAVQPVSTSADHLVPANLVPLSIQQDGMCVPGIGQAMGAARAPRPRNSTPAAFAHRQSTSATNHSLNPRDASPDGPTALAAVQPGVERARQGGLRPVCVELGYCRRARPAQRISAHLQPRRRAWPRARPHRARAGRRTGARPAGASALSRSCHARRRMSERGRLAPGVAHVTRWALLARPQSYHNAASTRHAPRTRGRGEPHAPRLSSCQRTTCMSPITCAWRR